MILRQSPGGPGRNTPDHVVQCNTMKTLKYLAASFAILALSGCGDPNITYKGLTLVRTKAEKVTAREVQNFINGLRDQMAVPSALAPTVPLSTGIRATIDFAGTIGGTPFQGGKAEGYPIVLGSGQMIPGFEEGMIGMKIGETRNVKVTFPADYQEASLAGKTAVFRIMLRGAESLTRPPLDDDLARKASRGQISTLAELKVGVREQLRQYKARETEQKIRMQAAEALVAQWKKEPAKKEIEAEVERLAERQAAAARQQGLSAEQIEMSTRAIREANRETIAKNMKLAKAITVIAKKEGIILTDEEVENAAKQMAQAQGEDQQKFMSYLKESKLLELFKQRILEDKVIAAVLQYANIQEAGTETKTAKGQ